MAEMISTQDIVNVKRDIEDTGKAVNEDVVVTPRYGEPFKSLPMIAREYDENGGTKGFNTLAEFEAVKATIPAHTVINIGEAGPNQGQNFWNGTTLTKSAYDPLTQAKAFAKLEANNVALSLTRTPYEITKLLSDRSTLNTVVLQFGYLGTTTSGTSADLATYVLSTPAATQVLIDKFSIVSNITSGDFELRLYSRAGNTFTMVKKVATLKVSKIGINTFTQKDFAPFKVEQGQYIAVTILTSGAMNYDAAGTEDTYYPLHIAETPFTASTVGKVKIKVAFYTANEVAKAGQFIDSIDLGVANSNAALEVLFIDYTATKGTTSTPAEKSGVNAGVAHYCIGVASPSFGKVTIVKVFSATAGAAQVGVYSKNGTSFTRKRFADVVLVAGLNEIQVNLPISAGEYVGLRTTLAGQVEYETTTSGHEGMFVAQAGSPADSFTASTSTPLTTYAYQLQFTLSLKIQNSSGNSMKWLGKKYVSFGDSITWYNGRAFFSSHNEAGTIAKGYQSYIVDALGCTLDNQGESGWTMPSIFSSRVNTYNFSDVYAVTITAGANDHKNSVPVGTVQPIGSAFNLSSYAGALQASIEKIINSNKDTKIFLITPIRGWYSQATADAITGEMQGVKLLSVRYADVMKEIGALYGLHVIDFYNEVGFNDLNKNTFLGDNAQTEADLYLLHPNNKGYQRMGELLLSKLKDF